MLRKVYQDYSRLLEKHGITILTGEADGVGMRWLCDVNAAGQDFLAEAFGGMTPTYPGWNDDESKSIMLFRELLVPLAIFALLRDGADCVLLVEKNQYIQPHLRAYWDVEWESLEWAKERDLVAETSDEHFRTYWKSGTAQGGLRNTHWFSGRNV